MFMIFSYFSRATAILKYYFLFSRHFEILREQAKFITTVYRKPNFTGAYSNFESFLPSAYKFDMTYFSL